MLSTHPKQTFATTSLPLAGLMGTETADLCLAGWHGWAVRVVITHGGDFLQERGKLSCVAVLMDLLGEVA